MKPVDRSLLEIFSSEQAEHIGRIRAQLEALANNSVEIDPSVLDEILRRAHTLKGAAHAVGVEFTEAIVHALETVFLKLRRAEVPFSENLRTLAERSLAAIEDILAAALAGTEPGDITALLDALRAFPHAPSQPAEHVAVAAAVAEPHATVSESDLMRVNANRIDSLVRSSSRLLVSAVLDTEAENPFTENARHLDHIEEEWRQMRRARRFEFGGDPALELQQANVCLNYMDRRLSGLRHRAQRAADAWETRSRDVRQRAEELYEDACNVRMTPAETVFLGLGPMVRELAQREHKQVEFRAEGLETQADRVVLQALKDPVMHLLRNAISHGAQPEAERLSAQKPSVNTIWLRIRSRGDRLNLTVQDDGRGIDEKAILEEATRGGFAPEATGAGIAKLLLMPGLSTAKETTSLSGRGLGLSIVNEAVTRLHGDISIRPALGGGIAVSISVPLAMSTQHVLLAAAGGFTFAISTSYIDRLARITARDVQWIDGCASVVEDSKALPLVRLADLLNLPGAKQETPEKLYVVLVSVSEERFAIVVDAMHDERDAIIKDTGLTASRAGFSAGAIPMDDGTVAVVLNLQSLLAHGTNKEPASNFLTVEPEKRPASILVVDDSLTTRSLEKSILESQGFRVRVAVDGVQALEQIRAETPDLVISDVMMPRMTGFELLAAMKADPSMKSIPVILVTSLESREEQAQGLELGADAYIVKQRFDQRELIRIVRQII